jgi:hypothetical protein
MASPCPILDFWVTTEEWFIRYPRNIESAFTGEKITMSPPA